MVEIRFYEHGDNMSVGDCRSVSLQCYSYVGSSNEMYCEDAYKRKSEENARAPTILVVRRSPAFVTKKGGVTGANVLIVSAAGVLVALSVDFATLNHILIAAKVTFSIFFLCERNHWPVNTAAIKVLVTKT